MFDNLLLADTLSGFALGYLFALFKREAEKQIALSRQSARNGAKGKGNLQAGRNIKHVLPMDVDGHLCRMQADKDRLFNIIMDKDAQIQELHRRLPGVKGFPVLNLSATRWRMVAAPPLKKEVA